MQRDNIYSKYKPAALAVYLASPWFKPDQMERCEYVRDRLDEVFNVFSPKDANLVPANASDDWRKTAFDGNINSIKSSDFVLAITDGLDSGTLFECGLAYANNIPIVYFAETLGDKQFNLMLAQSGVAVLRSRNDLDSFILNVVKYGFDEASKQFKYEGDIQ